MSLQQIPISYQQSKHKFILAEDAVWNADVNYRRAKNAIYNSKKKTLDTLFEFTENAIETSYNAVELSKRIFNEMKEIYKIILENHKMQKNNSLNVKASENISLYHKETRTILHYAKVLYKHAMTIQIKSSELHTIVRHRTFKQL